VAWVTKFISGDGKLLWRGYATRLDGDKIEVVPDSVLSSKSSVHSYATASTPDRLWARGSNGVNPLFMENVFFGEIPPERHLHDYYARKHGKLRGFNRLFPRRIQKSAAIEWVEEQLQQQPVDTRRESGLQRLRDNLRRAEDLVAAEKKALLNNREYAERPQPVDYGLTHDDVYPSAYALGDYRVGDGVKYKNGRRWFGILGGWKFFLASWVVLYSVAYAAVSSNIAAIRHFFNVSSISSGLTLGGAILLGLGVTLYLFVVLHTWVLEAIANYKRKHPSPSVSAYRRALELHESYKAAEQEAEQALQRRKRSYWELLDGYAFERETAEVLKRHQFNPRVTPVQRTAASI
jgi:hypothetical protein